MNRRPLLEEYVAGSEIAFREIVAAYFDLVYSTALRLVDQDAHLAEDISQMVFLDLARAAKSLSADVQLGGWLHRHTCFVSAKTLRAERRRHVREQLAAEMNAPDPAPNFAEAARILDEAINQLGAADRTAIVLRYFEGLDLAAVGEALGSNEDAAQKRVSRALEKLNRLLSTRGVKFSAAALATALSAQAVSAAPAGMAANVTTTVLVAARESVSTFSLIKLMAFSKTKMAAIVALFALGVAAPILFSHQSRANVHDLEKDVNAQNAKLLAVARKNQSLADWLKKMDQAALDHDAEISRLKIEAATLHQKEDETKSLRSQIHQLGLQRGGQKTYWQNNEENWARQKLTKAWLQAFLEYARAHEGQLPAAFDEADAFFPTNAAKGTTPPSEQFEILYHGSLQTLTNLDPKLEFMIFRERKLTPLLHNYGGTNYDKMGRCDALANGHESWGSSPEGAIDSEFNSYEQQILVPPGVQ